ncbi:hypothetical protein [Kibdelosporangium philippinense]|uniref:hypothetical protein n=1 Tax=Kibdelosporangium philippinense TaxID=211113 RepID=UPI00361F7CAB
MDTRLSASARAPLGDKAETTTMLPTITAFTTVRCYRTIYIQTGEHLPRIYDSGH